MEKPLACPHCGARGSLTGVGPGVERLAEEVHTRFRGARVEILSSDTVASAEDLRSLILSARQRISVVANSTTTLLYWHLGQRLLKENL